MNATRLLALACGVILASAPAVPAQPAPPTQPKPTAGPPIQKKEVQKSTYDDMRQNFAQGAGGYRFVSGDEVLRHGDFVAITRKVGAAKLTGVFVWADPKTGRLYVRTKAGQAPVGVSAREVEKIERIAPAAGTPDKGGVKPAFGSDDKPAPTYEIQTMTVHDGPITSIYYYDSSLSPAEREQLSALEKASNQVAQKRRTLDAVNQAIRDANNDGGANVALAGGGPNFVYPYYFQNYVLPYEINYPYYPNYLGYPIGAPFIYGQSAETQVIQTTANNGKAQAEMMKSLSDAEGALREAQKHYAAVSTRGVYDPSGHIVAVRLEE